MGQPLESPGAVSAPPRGPRFPLRLDRLGAAAGARPGPVQGSGPGGLLRPQRPLHEAARDGARRPPSAGHGLDSDSVRRRLVERLRAGGVDCTPVLDALAAVPRHRFVDSALVTQAYEDTSLPIGHGQTISKPSVVARMLSLLFETEAAQRRASLGRTLEIGTGCGYQTALLARLASRVLSVERLKPLHDKAAQNLSEYRADQRIRLVWGDGWHGHPPLAPYDSIIAAAGGDDLPMAWLDQLAVGGRLVAPVRDAGSTSQALIVVDRHAQGLTRRRLEGVLFVPLKSGVD